MTTYRWSGLALLVLGVMLVGGLAAAAGGGNGYVLMVHAWFEPYVEGTQHAPGTVSAIRDGDHLTFSAIPYSTVDSRPAVVREPRLEIVGRGTYAPNVGSDNPVCRRETTFAGHEGPLEACPTFRVPAADLSGEPVIRIVLHFVDDHGAQSEPLSVSNHQLIHSHIDAGFPPSLDALDRDVEPEPFLVEQVLDPVP